MWQAVHGSKDPVFGYGSDEVNQLRNITKRLGTSAWKTFFCRLGPNRLEMAQIPEIQRECSAERKGWECPGERRAGKDQAPIDDADLAAKLKACKDSGAFSLLDNILCFEPSSRLQPARAMEHKFFSMLRES